MLEIRVLMLCVYRLGLSVNNWVVFLGSEELGAWPRRLPDGYGHGIWSWKEPTSETTISNRCRKSRAKRGQMTNPESQIELVAQAKSESCFFSKGHFLPMAPYTQSNFWQTLILTS